MYKSRYAAIMDKHENDMDNVRAFICTEMDNLSSELYVLERYLRKYGETGAADIVNRCAMQMDNLTKEYDAKYDLKGGKEF